MAPSFRLCWILLREGCYQKFFQKQHHHRHKSPGQQAQAESVSTGRTRSSGGRGVQRLGLRPGDSRDVKRQSRGGRIWHVVIVLLRGPGARSDLHMHLSGSLDVGL